MRVVLCSVLLLTTVLVLTPTGAARAELAETPDPSNSPEWKGLALPQVYTQEVKEPEPQDLRALLQSVVRPDQGAHEPETVESPNPPSATLTKPSAPARSWLREVATGCMDLVAGLTPSAWS